MAFRLFNLKLTPSRLFKNYKKKGQKMKARIGPKNALKKFGGLFHQVFLFSIW